MLGPAERERFDAIAQKFAEQRTAMLQGYQNLSPTERRARFVELARSSEQVVQSVLSEQKIRRLKQILLQLQGITVFTQPEIADALKLTESQRQAMRQIEGDTFMMLGERSEAGDDNTRREARRRLMKSAMEQCLAKLTPAQSAIWKDMVGAPFNGHLSVPAPGILPPP
jgi:hypothetical protein